MTDDTLRPIPVKNVEGDGSHAPPFAALEIAGVDGEGRTLVRKPTRDGATDLLFAGAVGVDNQRYGVAYRSFPCRAAWSAATSNSGPPKDGEIWGAKKDEWKLTRSRPGFRCVGDGVAQVVWVVPQHAGLELFVKVTSDEPEEGRYPAIEQWRDPVAKTWADGDECWYEDANGGTPTVDSYRKAMLTGFANGKKVYTDAMTGGGGGGVTDCAAVRECVDNYPDGETVTVEVGKVCLTKGLLTIVDGVLNLDGTPMPDGVEVIVGGTNAMTLMTMPSAFLAAGPYCEDPIEEECCSLTVDSPCCEGVSLPSDLTATATIPDIATFNALMPGYAGDVMWGEGTTVSFPLNYNLDSGRWEGRSLIYEEGACSLRLEIKLWCNPDFTAVPSWPGGSSGTWACLTKWIFSSGCGPDQGWKVIEGCAVTPFNGANGQTIQTQFPGIGQAVNIFLFGRDNTDLNLYSTFEGDPCFIAANTPAANVTCDPFEAIPNSGQYFLASNPTPFDAWCEEFGTEPVQICFVQLAVAL